MKLAILGYGKMGKLVEELARRHNWEIGPKLDIDDNRGGQGITRAAMAGVHVALEFSQPDAVMDDIRAAARAGLNLVVGTTGWYDKLPEAKKTVMDSGIGLVYASNFSVGVNLFFDIVSHAAQAVAKLPQYDPFLYEQHHRAKKDAPSGTAITLLELMKPFLKHKVEISSSRAGFIPGNHIVGFDSEADTIILEHRARSRQGFAEGALLAARWVIGKQGFYDFQEIFPDVLQMTNDE